MTKLNQWVNLLTSSYSNQIQTCPECGGKINSLFFAKDTEDGKIGFAVLECEKCKARKEFSRVKFPDYVKTQEL